jgi:uncharacterized protein DUF4132/HEAT repeat protein
MGNFLGRIVDKLAGVAPGKINGWIERHFSGLREADPGLPRAVAAYILDGTSGSVLSTLGTPRIAGVWQSGVRIYPDDSPVADLLVRGELDAPLRFGEVMATLEPITHGWGKFGTKASPDWLRYAAARNDRIRTLLPVSGLAALAELGGAPASCVLDILFHRGPGQPYGTEHSTGLFSGVAEWLEANSALVIEQQRSLDAPGRVELAHAIGRFGLTGSYLELLLGFGTSTSKTVRAAAMKALTGTPRDALSRALDDYQAKSNAGARAELVALALGALGSDARPLLEAWREGETEKRPREALDQALANLKLGDLPATRIGPWDRGYVALDGSTVALPAAREPLPGHAHIPHEVYDLLRPTIDSYNARVRALREEHRQERHHWSRSQKLIGDGDLVSFRQAIETKGAVASRHSNEGLRTIQWSNPYVKWDSAGVTAFYAHPSVTLRHLIAILRAEVYGSFLNMLSDGFGHAAAQALRRRLKSAADFQVAADLWAEMGGEQPAVEYLQDPWMATLGHVDPELLWPHVGEAFEAIDEALGLRPQTHQRAFHAANALDLLDVLPKVPHRYLLALMTIATGSQKLLRQRARKLLAGAPAIDAAIEGLLADGKQETRAGAAEWLAARGTRTAVPALRKALKKEKSEVARAAIITALEALGDDVSDCFDPKGLLKEAEAGLAKTSAKGLEWFPFDLLPRVSALDGKPVDPAILRWWVVLANKLKQPGGNALFDLWLGRLAPDDARRLSLFVLRSWIEQDTRMPSDDEGNAHAAAHIEARLQSNLQFVRRHPQYAEYYITDRDKLFAQIKREMTGQYLGSASDSKGVLALATRAEGAEAAAAVRAFLKDHGGRTSQAKALLDVLAANPAAAAIQVVLATAGRFKARTVREHAEALIERIADRRGWTPEELADRTVPSAGLDERGECELECGEGRTYRLRLDADDALTLLNPAGQPAKALPNPRNDEEKPLVAAAKKQVAIARKELKQTQAAQTERLFEAMCLERRWPVEDWARHLLAHPIVGRLAQRLVWIGLDEDGRQVALLRPLDDGSLSDVEDAEVPLDRLAQVQIAHASLVSAAEAEAWRAHLADYEICSPFPQFEQDMPALSASLARDHAIDDRKGWMIETFKLRGTAGKLGFVRGAAEDGGVFMTYERRYETAKLVAVIEFTGSPLPEENIPAALQELRFARLASGGGWHGAGIPLGEVPPVMLAESWKAFHLIAAAGTGFDPEWEKKAGW